MERTRYNESIEALIAAQETEQKMDTTLTRATVERHIAEATEDAEKHREKAEAFLSDDEYTKFHWHSGAAYYAEKMAHYLRIALDVADDAKNDVYSIAQ